MCINILREGLVEFLRSIIPLCSDLSADLLAHNGYGAPFTWFDRKENEEERQRELAKEEELRQRIGTLEEVGQ